MVADWVDVKNVLVNRGLSAQCVVLGSNYWIKAIDGVFELECVLPTSTSNPDSLDFTTNFLPTANQRTTSNIQGVVTTQYELNDKDLKLACGTSVVDAVTGVATVTIPIPGVMANGDGRYIAGGTAFFDVATSGDMVNIVQVIDIDNVLGAGANYVVKSYIDTEQGPDNQGWFIPIKRGHIEVEPIGGYGFIPSQLYLQISAKKAAGSYTGNFYMNIFWGKKE